MSLLMIDLAYLGTKSLLSIGYYVAKGTYKGIAYLTGNEQMDESENVSEEDLLREIKNLRGEMDSLRKEIRHINEDTFLLVDPNITCNNSPKVIAEIANIEEIPEDEEEIEKETSSSNDKKVIHELSSDNKEEIKEIIL